jgi:hypothetical protein
MWLIFWIEVLVLDRGREGVVGVVGVGTEEREDDADAEARDDWRLSIAGAETVSEPEGLRRFVWEEEGDCLLEKIRHDVLGFSVSLEGLWGLETGGRRDEGDRKRLRFVEVGSWFSGTSGSRCGLAGRLLSGMPKILCSFIRVDVAFFVLCLLDRDPDVEDSSA